MTKAEQAEALNKFVQTLPAGYEQESRWRDIEGTGDGTYTKATVVGGRELRISCFPDLRIRASAGCAAYIAHSASIRKGSELLTATQWLEGGNFDALQIFERTMAVMRLEPANA